MKLLRQMMIDSKRILEEGYFWNFLSFYPFSSRRIALNIVYIFNIYYPVFTRVLGHKEYCWYRK